jgi:hypothetical protein
MNTENTNENLQKEFKKCKEDIVYFVENYIHPKIELTNWEKEYLRSIYGGTRVKMFKGRKGNRLIIMHALKEHERFIKETKQL